MGNDIVHQAKIDDANARIFVYETKQKQILRKKPFDWFEKIMNLNKQIYYLRNKILCLKKLKDMDYKASDLITATV